MTPEEKEREEKLVALVAANRAAREAIDAVNRANIGHIAISKANQQSISFVVDPAERRHAEMIEAIKGLKPKPRPTRKDIITGKALVKRREKPCERREKIEKFLRSQLQSLALLRERNYYEFRETITHKNKQNLANLLGMPVSTFGRLVNGSETLTRLCNAVMNEEAFKRYLSTRSRIV